MDYTWYIKREFRRQQGFEFKELYNVCLNLNSLWEE